MIGMALCCRPSLLIADEPTTALDATVQAQILQLIHSLQQETGMSVMFITHDMGVVAEIADQVIVMNGGKCVEAGPVADVLTAPTQSVHTVAAQGGAQTGRPARAAASGKIRPAGRTGPAVRAA